MIKYTASVEFQPYMGKQLHDLNLMRMHTINSGGENTYVHVSINRYLGWKHGSLLDKTTAHSEVHQNTGSNVLRWDLVLLWGENMGPFLECIWKHGSILRCEHPWVHCGMKTWVHSIVLGCMKTWVHSEVRTWVHCGVKTWGQNICIFIHICIYMYILYIYIWIYIHVNL